MARIMCGIIGDIASTCRAYIISVTDLRSMPTVVGQKSVDSPTATTELLGIKLPVS